MNMRQHWHAKWIWDAGIPRELGVRNETLYFRRTFDVADSNTGRLVVSVSADSRYRLFLNGESVSFGPCKGNAHEYYYETVDVSDKLRPGKNVLAAVVVHYPPFNTSTSPESIWRSPWGGFLLEGALINEDGTEIEALHTDERWLCKRDAGVTYAVDSWFTSIWLSGVERVDGSLLPHGWETIEYDDGNWSNAVSFESPNREYGELGYWKLSARRIPLMYEQAKAFTRIMRRGEDNGTTETDESSLFTLLGEDAKPLTIGPNEKFVVELDAGELTTGFLRFAVAGGRGSTIRLLTSECYENPHSVPGTRNKGVRDDASEGQVLLGDTDEYTVGGFGNDDRSEHYEPFWFRTFRFVRLSIETKGEPLVIRSFAYRETGYPLDVTAKFASSDASFGPLWDISVRTLRRCMHETYEDCPFYEQLQYTMDTRLQMLFTYRISGDDRLARKAIHDFHSSMLPDGMLQSRYPAFANQIIPGFALHWVGMVYDHYMHFGDAAFVRRYRPTIDAVLDWFDRLLDENGLVGSAPSNYWSFVDWTTEWNPHKGVPTAANAGPIAVYSLMYASSLKEAAVCLKATGRADTAEEYSRRAVLINESVVRTCWSDDKGLFRDGPAVSEFSQQTQLWSVLSGAVAGEHAKQLMNKALDDKSLVQSSYSMAFFLFRALSSVGLYDRAYELWDSWRAMAALNLTTWMEDPVGKRSDCHAWGSVPLYDFLAESLGVNPDEPGFSRIRLEPKLGSLTEASGLVPTPQGDVSVQWRIADGKFHMRAEGPRHVPLIVKLPDGTESVFDGSVSIDVSCRIG